MKVILSVSSATSQKTCTCVELCVCAHIYLRSAASICVSSGISSASLWAIRRASSRSRLSCSSTACRPASSSRSASSCLSISSCRDNRRRRINSMKALISFRSNNIPTEQTLTIQVKWINTVFPHKVVIQEFVASVLCRFFLGTK